MQQGTARSQHLCCALNLDASSQPSAPSQEDSAAASCIAALPQALAPRVLHLMAPDARARAVCAMPLDAAAMSAVSLGSADREATLAALPKALASRLAAVLAYGTDLVGMPVQQAADTLVRIESCCPSFLRLPRCIWPLRTLLPCKRG